MNEVDKFKQQVSENIAGLGADDKLKAISTDWVQQVSPYLYTYNFTWASRPIIQLPQDIVAIQELIWRVKPDLIIEMGIAHGGSLIFNASLLAMLDYCEAIEKNSVLDPSKSKRKVLGVDIDIRAHNKELIEAHPLSKNISMIEGSSISKEVIEQVQEIAKQYETILVILDSNHTHQHVLQELNAYTPLVSTGSYCVVMDTAIEDYPSEAYDARPWGKGNNPKTAVWAFLQENKDFEIDTEIDNKLVLSCAPNGYLKKLV